MAEESGLTEAEVQALIDASIAASLEERRVKDSYRFYGGTDIAGSQIRQNGGTTTITFGTWCPIISLASAGANKFRHHVIERVIQGDELFATFPSHKYGVKAITHMWGTTPTVAGTAWGIQIGTPYSSGIDTSPPWDTNPSTSYIRLYGDMDGVWKMSTAVGADLSAVHVETSVVPASLYVDHTLELFYDPSVPSVKGWVDGTLVFNLTNTAYLPQFSAANWVGDAPLGGVFAEHGNSAGEGVVLDVAGFTCYNINTMTEYPVWY
jgi:hypothetical protein